MHEMRFVHMLAVLFIKQSIRNERLKSMQNIQLIRFYIKVKTKLNLCMNVTFVIKINVMFMKLI